jgi:SNF2 family DNA or RNA helicase
MAQQSKELILNYTFRKNRPYPHQVRALKRALDLDKAIALHMEPGTGKTRVAIDFTGIKHLQGLVNKVLIVCPNVAIEVWQDQIHDYLTKKIKRNVIPLSKKDVGSVEKRIEELRKHRKVSVLTYIIVNYDVIYKMRDYIRQWRPDVIVLDESHYIKHHYSDRSRALHSLGNTARWKMTLSGTPITNSPLDIFSQFKFLDPSIFGTRWNSFKHKFAVYGGFGGFKLLKYKDLDKMSELASGIAFEATKDEMDLPAVSEPQLVRVPMDTSTKKIYDVMEKEMIVEVDGLGNKATAAIILTKLIRLRQICGGFLRTEITNEEGVVIARKDLPVGKQEKLAALKELLADHVLEGGYKVVIFASFVWEQQAIYELCGKMGIKALRDKGSKEERKIFQKDPQCKVFIVSLSKGGIAVNELVAAHIGIFYSLDHFSDHFTQAKDRLHRPGQTHNVTYQVLALKGTVDEDIFKALTTNKEIADYVTFRMKKRH